MDPPGVVGSLTTYETNGRLTTKTDEISVSPGSMSGKLGTRLLEKSELIVFLLMQFLGLPPYYFESHPVFSNLNEKIYRTFFRSCTHLVCQVTK